MTSDPVRLFDDPSAAEALRADLAHAAEGCVEGFDVAAGAAGLRAAIAAEAGATAGASSAGASAGSGVMKAVLALGVVAGGAAAWWTSAPEPSQEPQVVAVAKAPASDAPAVVDPIEPADAPEEPAPQEASPTLEPPADTPSVAPAKEAPTTPPVAETAEEPPEVSKKPRAHKRPANVASTKADDHLKEARLIAQARRSLRSKPAQALGLLKQAQREFPEGMLREEAEALSILALVELGRTSAAKPRAKAFLARHSESPYAEAVRRALAADAG